jgi:hypothetical protein
LKGDVQTRAEITELTDTLRDNLDKVVQHGKRADAIAKNMLLHSREGSGEHRLVDVNALVEESLNLAYHGARAEKQRSDTGISHPQVSDVVENDGARRRWVRARPIETYSCRRRHR